MNQTTNQTEYRRQLSEKILRESMSEFTAKGIKAVRMDDIASSLGISKRTLYEIYSNKEELLLAGVKMFEMRFDRKMAEFSNNPNVTSIDLIIEFFNSRMRLLSEMNVTFLSELEKYTAVVEYVRNRNKERRSLSVAFFKRGVDEGYFRDDVDFEFISILSETAMDGVMQDSVMKQYGVRCIFRNAILLFIRGICTQKGVERLDAAIH